MIKSGGNHGTTVSYNQFFLPWKWEDLFFFFFCNTQRVVQLTWFKGATVSLLTTEASCQCDLRLLKQGPFIFSSTVKLYQALCPAAIVSYSFVRKYAKKLSALLTVTMGLAIYWRESCLQCRTRRALQQCLF